MRARPPCFCAREVATVVHIAASGAFLRFWWPRSVPGGREAARDEVRRSGAKSTTRIPGHSRGTFLARSPFRAIRGRRAGSCRCVCETVPAGPRGRAGGRERLSRCAREFVPACARCRAGGSRALCSLGQSCSAGGMDALIGVTRLIGTAVWIGVARLIGTVALIGSTVQFGRTRLNPFSHVHAWTPAPVPPYSPATKRRRGGERRCIHAARGRLGTQACKTSAGEQR